MGSNAVAPAGIRPRVAQTGLRNSRKRLNATRKLALRPHATQEVVLAFDIGTTATKSCALDVSGRILASATAPYARATTSNGCQVEQCPDNWLEAARSSCRDTLAALEVRWAASSISWHRIGSRSGLLATPRVSVSALPLPFASVNLSPLRLPLPPPTPTKGARVVALAFTGQMQVRRRPRPRRSARLRKRFRSPACASAGRTLSSRPGRSGAW